MSLGFGLGLGTGVGGLGCLVWFGVGCLSRQVVCSPGLGCIGLHILVDGRFDRTKDFGILGVIGTIIGSGLIDLTGPILGRLIGIDRFGCWHRCAIVGHLCSDLYVAGLVRHIITEASVTKVKERNRQSTDKQKREQPKRRNGHGLVAGVAHHRMHFQGVAAVYFMITANPNWSNR